MRKRYLTILFFVVLCSCNYIGEHGYGVRVENRSSLKQIVCILNLDYSIDDLVREGDLYSAGTTQVWFRRTDPKDWRKFLPDSVCLFIIDPLFSSVNFFGEKLYDTSLSVNEAQQINDNPECIIAKYYLSEDQFIKDYGKYKFFPPDETMQTAVRMWPSFEELVAKYSKH